LYVLFLLLLLSLTQNRFLLARLQMDELLRQRHKRAFLRTLDTLPRTPDALYDAAIDRIEHQQADDASLAKQSLAWVYYAFEPVSVNLLQYALAIQPGDNMIDEDGCVDVEVLVTLCGGLIVLDRDSKVIRFVHTTTRTYFDQYYRRQKQQQEAQLTVTCLTFLLSTTFENFADASFRALRSKVRFDLCGNSRMMEFLVYASRHALSHYKSTKKSPKCFALVQQLFTGNETLAIFWRARWRSLTKACGWYLGQVTDSDKLCLASFLGLDGIVSWLLDSGISPNTQDSTGQTALYAAASRGEESVVKVLLAREADPNQISFDNPSSLEIDSNAQRFCQTPMHCALRSGNVITAQTLINHGVELHPSTYDSKTCVSPLRIAIQSNSRDMVEFVLKHRHEDLYEGGGLDAQPPLHDAIENGAVDVVAALLEAGASTTKTSRRGHSPVETAIVAPIWRVSDDKSEQICKLIVAHCPSRYSLSRNVRFGQYATWNAGTRPRTFQYLKSVGAWNWSGKFLDQRRRSI
jgi:ankyrin repeat protein